MVLLTFLTITFPMYRILNMFILATMSTFKPCKQTRAGTNAKDNKSATGVRQIIAGSATLQRGRVSPLRRIRWPVRVQPSKRLMFFNKVFLGVCVAVT